MSDTQQTDVPMKTTLIKLKEGLRTQIQAVSKRASRQTDMVPVETKTIEQNKIEQGKEERRE